MYPLVGRYVGELLAERMDTVRHLAIANRILIQAEAEGKEYVEGLLKAAGKPWVKVTFGDEGTDKEVMKFNAGQLQMLRSPHTHAIAKLEEISFGFIPTLTYP